MTDRFIDIKEVCRQAGYGKTAVWEMAGNDEFPPAHHPYGRSARWSENEVQEWIRLRKAGIEWKDRDQKVAA